MFHLLRIVFLTIFDAYRPVFAQPRKLYWITIAPVLVALAAIYVVVPLAQDFVLTALAGPIQASPLMERIAYRVPVLIAELLALVPWLWLATVLMMNWPRIRQSSAPLYGTLSVFRHRKIWTSTAFMVAVCAAMALAFDALIQWQHYLADINDNYGFQSKGTTAGFALGLSLVVLSPYCLVIHGLAIGQPISARDCRRRLKGHSSRLFMSLFMVALAPNAVFPAGRSKWGSGPMDLPPSDVISPRVTVDYAFDPGFLIEVFVFAFAICAMSEVIARTYSRTHEQPAEVPEPTVAEPV